MSTTNSLAIVLRPLAAGACLLACVACEESAPTPDATSDSASSDQAPDATTTASDAPSATPTPTAQASGDSEPTTLMVSGIAFDVPGEWETQSPASSMRVAQYGLGAQGGTPATLAFFKDIGGGPQANIDRWIGQVQNPQGDPEIIQREAGQLTIDEVRVTGTIAGAPMMRQPEINDAMLLGAVISGGPGSPVFVKVTGPREVLEGELERWEALLASVRVPE